jgi:hypothetical protein
MPENEGRSTIEATMSRRRFVRIASAVGVASGATLVSFGVSPALRRSLRDRRLKLALPAGGRGALSERAAANLTALIDALLSEKASVDRYLSMFDFRAREIDNERALMERFAADLDDLAVDATGQPFASSGRADRIRWIGDISRVDRRRRDRLLALATRPLWLLYDHHIVEPVLTLYSRTDAWLELGYPDHPGMARGLEHYVSLPDGGNSDE